MLRRGFASSGPVPTVAPTVVQSALTPQKEGEGTAAFAATLASDAAAGRTLLALVGIRTSIFAGPAVANNGNTYTQHDSLAYPSPFDAYSMRLWRAYGVAGGSAHSASGTKSSGTTEEVTVALVSLSGGAITAGSPAMVVRTANGAGATHTSPSVSVNGAALLIAWASGTGDVNATAPTQTWPGDWTVLQSVSYSSAQAPNGHIPLYIAAKTVQAGTHSVGVQVTINEGLLMGIVALQG